MTLDIEAELAAIKERLARIEEIVAPLAPAPAHPTYRPRNPTVPQMGMMGRERYEEPGPANGTRLLYRNR